MDKLSPVREQRLKDTYQCVEGAGASGASARDVAKCLKLTVSPHIFELLDQLVELGWARKEMGIVETGRGLRSAWRYYIIPAAS